MSTVKFSVILQGMSPGKKAAGCSKHFPFSFLQPARKLIFSKRNPIMKTDILISGSGCSGLYCALQLPRDKKITIITKSDLTSNDSYLAQGGMCMLKEESDYDSFFEDTMKAGHYENDKKAVDLMIRSSNSIIRDLLQRNVTFARTPDGELDFTREGAHSQPRILFYEDITGKQITQTLL